LPLTENRLLLQPDLETLGRGLRSVFAVSRAGMLTILDRERNAYSSGSLSEIVTCSFVGGRTMRLLVKYAQYPEAANYHHISHEPFIVMPWSNVPYEAEVYRHVLGRFRFSTPKFYGTYQEPGSGRLWLVLEYLENSISLDEVFDDSPMGLAAAWLGRFHAVGEQRVPADSLSFLKRLDATYYSDFASRALSHARRLDRSFSWLPKLCSNFDSFVSSICHLRPTIIHGDYYRNNILLREGNIHPIDWEQAAIGLGELDLACLGYRWPANINRWCELEYQRSRWPQGSPEDFDRILNAARLVLYLDEIRNVPGWTDNNERLIFNWEMLSLGERLGLI